MNKQKILVVEDEKKIAELLKDYLKAEGYDVECLFRGDTALSYVEKQPSDLILLDIQLPGMNGVDVCRRIRKFSDVPIIMLTARVEETDRIVGLELGADDYICKPFSPREVMARVKAVLRRTSSDIQAKTSTPGNVRIDDDLHWIMIYDKKISLTPSEYSLLKVMLSYPCKVFSRAELLDKARGYNFEGYDRTIDTHIKNIRKKLAVLFPDHRILSRLCMRLDIS